MLNNVNYDIDITKEPPADDTARQYYFIEKAKAYVQRESEELGRPLTFCVTTFGCQMNARDSEKLCGILEKIGYVEAAEDEADFIIFNTCTVRENANMRVYGRLGQLKPRKKKNPHMMIGLCGCMMQEPEVVEKLKTSYRYVDIIFGTHNIFKFAELIVTRFESQRMVIDIWKDTDKIVENLPNDRKFSFKSGVNIMFGCNNFCSYCIVPYVRGRERSRDPEAIISEIRQLVADGVVEVMLLGQNVNSYGKNLEHPITFAQLLERIEQIEGLERIRFMTSHPKDLSDELIEVMAAEPKICHYIDIPIQHAADPVLRAMNRPYTRAGYLELIRYARRVMPDLVLTSDIIIGFPGETEAEAMDTVSLINEVHFDALFTFIFSPRPGTPAAKLDDPTPREEKQKWFDALCNAQNAYIGRTVRVLVEGESDDADWPLSARTEGNRLVRMKGDKSLIGTFTTAKISGSNTWALYGAAEETI